MRQLRKCSYVVTATFLDHDKVQKTDLKPLQLVKSEWSPPLQQLPVSSVSTKCLRIDSTKYSCVQFDVQFSTFVVNKLQCTFAWICVDFSWKTAFISYHVMSAKTCVLKCCCLLFDWPEFWESSPHMYLALHFKMCKTNFKNKETRSLYGTIKIYCNAILRSIKPSLLDQT